MSHPNPFVNHSLNKHPSVSYAMAVMMETAWDDAINAAIAAARKTRGRVGVGDLKRLLSTRQRDPGSATNMADANRRNIGKEWFDKLTPEQASEVISLAATKYMAAVRLFRQYTNAGLAESVYAVRDYLPTLARIKTA